MDDWPEDFRDFRMAREAELTEPYGWLTLRGFHWLDDQPAELAGLPGRWWADGDQARAHLEATPADGLTVDLVNKTPLRAYTCISNATWEVYEGTSVGGTPVRTLSGWEPDLDLSEEGPGDYTIVLNVGGLGGTGAAMTNIKVGRGAGCSHVPGWSWAFVAPLFLVGLSRRRD